MQKNVASQKIGAQMVSATDGSAFTGSVTVYVTGDAGTQAAGSVGSGACTHEGNGYHTYAPAQAETNYDLIAFTFTGTGAIPQTIQVETRVDANVTHYGGTAGTFSGGRPEVNTTLIEGSDATNQIRDSVVDDATRIDASALNTLSSHDPGEAIMGATDLGTGSGLTSLATAASISALNNVSEQAVHNQVHLALTDAGLVLQHTTIATLASQTSFTLSAGSPSNDAYNGCVIVVRNESGTYNKIAVGYVSDYVGLSLTVTLAADPGVFTMAVGDTVSIYPKHAATLATIAALNNLSQADVRTAVGLGSANLDTQLGDLPTNAELSSALASADDATLAAIAALNNLSAATVRTQCDDALIAIHLDHLLAEDYDPASKPGTATALLNELIGSDAGVSQFTANALELAPSGGSGSSADTLNTTTIATLASQTQFTLTAGSADDKAYEGCLAVITDASTSTQKAVAPVLSYTGSTKTVRLAYDPGVFTMATTDTIAIIAASERPVVHVELSVKSTAGTTAQLAVWVEVAGKIVPVATIDASASCSVVVREHDAGVNLFTASGAASDITNSVFQYEQASPGFTDDRQYIIVATVTLNGVAFSSTHNRVVIG